MFESTKNKYREIKVLRQKQLESLPDYVSNSTLKKMIKPFTIFFSLLLAIFITIGILIYPIYLLGICGWVAIVIYISAFPLTIAGILLVSFLTYKLSLWAIIKFFLTTNFDIKLLISGIISTLVLVFITEYWMIYNAFFNL